MYEDLPYLRLGVSDDATDNYKSTICQLLVSHQVVLFQVMRERGCCEMELNRGLPSG